MLPTRRYAGNFSGTHRSGFLLLENNPCSNKMMALPPANPADEVYPGLWLGNRQAALDPAFLKEKKILTVFNCTKDIPFEASVTRRYRVPVDDNLRDEEIRNLELWSFEIVYKIGSELRLARKEGKAVLVHCAAGMQRSAASIAMYLVASQNLQTEQAIAYLQSKRPIAFRPSANFERAIRGFEDAFNREVRPKLN
jgi:dual specificity phosphatase 12